MSRSLTTVCLACSFALLAIACSQQEYGKAGDHLCAHLLHSYCAVELCQVESKVELAKLRMTAQHKQRVQQAKTAVHAPGKLLCQAARGRCQCARCLGAAVVARIDGPVLGGHGEPPERRYEEEAEGVQLRAQ